MKILKLIFIFGFFSIFCKIEAADGDSLRKFTFVDAVHFGLDLVNTGVFLFTYSTIHNVDSYHPELNGFGGFYLGRFAIVTPIELIAWKHYKGQRSYELIVGFFPALSPISKETVLPSNESDWMMQTGQVFKGVQTKVIFGGEFNVGSSTKLLINQGENDGSSIYFAQSYFSNHRLVHGSSFLMDIEPSIEFGFLLNDYSIAPNDLIDATSYVHSLKSILIGPGCALHFLVVKYLSISLFDSLMYGPYLLLWDSYKFPYHNVTGGFIKDWGVFNQLTLGVGVTF